MLIGVIGKSGAGKSTLVNKMSFIDGTIVHIDIDKIGHDILKDEEVINNIVRIVGDSSIVEKGAINRRKVGDVIFKDKLKYEEYFQYTEHLEYKIIDEIIENNKNKKIVLDWAVLFKTKYYSMLDYLILVDTPYEVRKQRVTNRDDINEEYFDLREVMYENYVEDADIVIDGTNIDKEVVKTILGELR